MLFVILSILSLLFTSVVLIWLLISYTVKPKLWPFKKCEICPKHSDGKVHDLKKNDDTSKPSTAVTIIIVIVMIIVIPLIIFGAYWSIKMTILRYKLVGQAIDKGESGTAAALMAPEIGQGISSVIRG